MIPKTLNGWVTLAIGLGLVLMAAYMGTVGQQPPLWAVLLNAGLGFLGLYLKGGGKEIGGTGTGLIAAALLAVLMLPGCKVPPIVTAYRAHGLYLAARDAGGETLAKIQRIKMTKCEADHSPLTAAGKKALIACLKAAREPVRVWVKHVKPALTAIAAGFWLALEAAHAAGRKDLDKVGKATLLACSTLTAGEAAIKPYVDKLGSLKAVILGALAGGKVLICQ